MTEEQRLRELEHLFREVGGREEAVPMAGEVWCVAEDGRPLLLHAPCLSTRARIKALATAILCLLMERCDHRSLADTLATVLADSPAPAAPGAALHLCATPPPAPARRRSDEKGEYYAETRER